MNPYESTAAGLNIPADPEPDPRIVAVRRLVDLERQWDEANTDAEMRAKKAAAIREELEQARAQLYNFLDVTPNASTGMVSFR